MSPLIALWNAESGALPKIRRASPKLAALVDLRMAEHPDLAEWREVIRRIASSPYCNGVNEAGWRANFRFLLNERTFRYALAGTYDDRTKASNGFDPSVGKPLPMEEREEA